MPSLRWTFPYSVTIIIALMVFSDIGYMFVHMAYTMDIVSHPHYSLTKDRGYAEVFQYLKIFWIICLLGLLFIRQRSAVLLAWAAIFGYMLLDDSLQIHETVGHYLVTALGIEPAFRLRAQDLGELLVTAIAGAFLFSFLAIAYFKAAPHFRQITHKLLLLVAGIAFFGIVIDMVHIIMPWGNSFFGMLEDGGEMVIMSLVVGYCFHLLCEAHRRTPGLNTAS